MKIRLRKFIQPIGKGTMWFVERGDAAGRALAVSQDESQMQLLGFLGLIDRKNGEWVLAERELEL